MVAPRREIGKADERPASGPGMASQSVLRGAVERHDGKMVTPRMPVDVKLDTSPG